MGQVTHNLPNQEMDLTKAGEILTKAMEAALASGLFKDFRSVEVVSSALKIVVSAGYNETAKKVPNIGVVKSVVPNGTGQEPATDSTITTSEQK